MQVWIDGRTVDASVASISPLDAGFRLGDGVFSTLLAVDGVPQHLDAHVARTVHDAAGIGITGIPADRLREAAHAVAAANRAAHPVLVLRLLVTRGAPPPDAPFGALSDDPTVAVLASPAPAPGDGTTTVATVEGGRRPATVKSTSWAWSAHAVAQARAAGAGTALLVEGGRVLEGAAANVVVALDGALLTPPADGSILPGTTRALLLADATLGLREATVTVDDLARADAVVLTSAVRGAVRVTAVDDRPAGSPRGDAAVAALRGVLATSGVGPSVAS